MGVGLLPGPRGTYASAVVLIAAAAWLYRTAHPLCGAAYWTVLALVCVLAFFSIKAALRHKVFGPDHDPSQIVTDEAAGMLLALHGTGRIGWELFAAFALFRFFDILKPMGIDRSQRLPGAWGVLVDDLLAGLYTLIIINLIAYALKVFGAQAAGA